MTLSTTPPAATGPLGDTDQCACMGPMFGEPLCWCDMKRAGLPLNEAARAESHRKLGQALEQVFSLNARRPCEIPGALAAAGLTPAPGCAVEFWTRDMSEQGKPGQGIPGWFEQGRFWSHDRADHYTSSEVTHWRKL